MIDFMRTCSSVISDDIPDQNLSERLIVKNPSLANFSHSNTFILLLISVISCKYKCADLAYKLWLVAWKNGIIC